jgi:hypothetical protein
VAPAGTQQHIHCRPCSTTAAGCKGCAATCCQHTGDACNRCLDVDALKACAVARSVLHAECHTAGHQVCRMLQHRLCHAPSPTGSFRSLPHGAAQGLAACICLQSDKLLKIPSPRAHTATKGVARQATMPKHRPHVYLCNAVVHGTLRAGPPLAGTDASKCMLALLDISAEATPEERSHARKVSIYLRVHLSVNSGVVLQVSARWQHAVCDAQSRRQGVETCHV